MTAAPHFLSLADLRAAHQELLKATYGPQQYLKAVPDVVREFLARAQATGVVLDAPSERDQAQSVLDYWTAKLYNFLPNVSETVLAEFDENLAPELADCFCPYVGLGAFQENDRDKFYGRESLVEEALAKLDQGRGLLVTGPSGCGKSSLLLAGLLSALKAGRLPGSAGWRHLAPLVPGTDPLTGLALLVKPPAADTRSWVDEHAKRFRDDPGHLHALVDAGGLAPVLLMVDQAEELFTLCTDEAARLAFAENLARLIESPTSGHRLVVSLRSELLSRALEVGPLRGMADSVQTVLRLTPLSARELRRAIEEPALRVGLKFAEGVVDDLVQEVVNEPAGLPLLQFTLRELWERRSRNRITWDTYRRLGRPRQALAQAADELYEQMLPQDQVIMRRVFWHLSRPDEEGMEFTRNRVRRESLYLLATPEQVNRVMGRGAAAGVLRLTPGATREDDRVEVTHEALIRNWPRLGKWLEDVQRVEADVQTRLIRRLKVGITVLTVLFVLALAAMTYALVKLAETDEAKRKADEAGSRDSKPARIYLDELGTRSVVSARPNA